jgi:hypothetical protein
MGEGVNSSMIYLIYCKYFCGCHNVSSPSITIKANKVVVSVYAWLDIILPILATHSRIYVFIKR